MGMERWKKIRQGNKKCRGAWCVLLHELGPGIARLFGSFFYVSTFFGVERGGIGGFVVFDIHTLPPLYLRYGRYYMVGDSAVAPASSCRSGLPDLGLVF